MTNEADQYHHRSVRMKGYDYSQAGAYFVTLVTYRRRNLFGNIVDHEIRLNEFGQIVVQSCVWLSQQYPYVNLDPHIVMPNHFHAIIQIVEIDINCRGGSRPAPTKIKPLGQLVGAFKTTSAKLINKSRHTQGDPVWQRNYYEHIIRNQLELEQAVGYILSNPPDWNTNPEYQDLS